MFRTAGSWQMSIATSTLNSLVVSTTSIEVLSFLFAYEKQSSTRLNSQRAVTVYNARWLDEL